MSIKTKNVYIVWNERQNKEDMIEKIFSSKEKAISYLQENNISDFQYKRYNEDDNNFNLIKRYIRDEGYYIIKKRQISTDRSYVYICSDIEDGEETSYYNDKFIYIFESMEEIIEHIIASYEADCHLNKYPPSLASIIDRVVKDRECEYRISFKYNHKFTIREFLIE